MAEANWTSRKRLLAALTGGIPDRVPVSTYELVGYNSGAWENRQPSYARLMDRIRRDTDCVAMWNPAYNARFLASAHPVSIDAHTQRSADGHITRTTQILHTPKGDLRQVLEVDDRVYTTWVIEHWCKNTDDVDRALSVPYVPVTADAGDWARIRAEVGEHGIVMPSLADPAYIVGDLMSFEDYMVWAFEQTEHFARAVEVLAERVMENLRRELSVCVADLYRICGPEYMTPPYTPPHLFRRFMVPHVTRMTEMLHDAGAKVRLHCHGKIRHVLEMILHTGCDAMDPCEPPPDGDIELDEIRRCCRAAGREVCLFGNIELKVLEAGTPRDVRHVVRRAIEQAGRDGRFVLMPTAAPINIPLAPQTEANYHAYIDAALEFGKS